MRECDNAPALQAWFDRLAGQWRVERRSSDGSSFTGDAVFARREDGSFQLEETGNLRLANGQSLPARRGWIWSFCPGNGEAGDAVEIRATKDQQQRTFIYRSGTVSEPEREAEFAVDRLLADAKDPVDISEGEDYWINATASASLAVAPGIIGDVYLPKSE